MINIRHQHVNFHTPSSPPPRRITTTIHLQYHGQDSFTSTTTPTYHRPLLASHHRNHHHRTQQWHSEYKKVSSVNEGDGGGGGRIEGRKSLSAVHLPNTGRKRQEELPETIRHQDNRHVLPAMPCTNLPSPALPIPPNAPVLCLTLHYSIHTLPLRFLIFYPTLLCSFQLQTYPTRPYLSPPLPCPIHNRLREKLDNLHR